MWRCCAERSPPAPTKTSPPCLAQTHTRVQCYGQGKAAPACSLCLLWRGHPGSAASEALALVWLCPAEGPVPAARAAEGQLIPAGQGCDGSVGRTRKLPEQSAVRHGVSLGLSLPLSLGCAPALDPHSRWLPAASLGAGLCSPLCLSLLSVPRAVSLFEFPLGPERGQEEGPQRGQLQVPLPPC